MRETRREGNYCDYAVVQYGDYDHQALITDSSDDDYNRAVEDGDEDY